MTSGGLGEAFIGKPYRQARPAKAVRVALDRARARD